MPNCDKYLEDLINCLRQSTCVTVHQKTLPDCRDRLPNWNKLELDASDPTKTINPNSQTIDPIAPMECKLKNRLFNECKLNLLNPRRRLRGSYGGEKRKSEQQEDVLQE